MISGELYKADNPELVLARTRARLLTDRFNQSDHENPDERTRILKELFASTGQNFCIEPPFRCDYGFNISIGDNFYANFDCIILDICQVSIGRNVLLGPRVCIYAAEHPVDATVRAAGLERGRPVTIGDNVWIGGNTVINPGVSVGDNVVIGSGSVVTRNIPPDTVAAGAPCKVIRRLSQADADYWQHLQKDYLA